MVMMHVANAAIAIVIPVMGVGMPTILAGNRRIPIFGVIIMFLFASQAAVINICIFCEGLVAILALSVLVSVSGLSVGIIRDGFVLFISIRIYIDYFLYMRMRTIILMPTIDADAITIVDMTAFLCHGIRRIVYIFVMTAVRAIVSDNTGSGMG